MPDTPSDELEPLCPTCKKVLELCVCDGIEVFGNRTSVVVLQHPQEQDRELGTARLALAHFSKTEFKIGLSWPNLSKAVGRPAEARHWGTLYLGPAPGSGDIPHVHPVRPAISVLDRHGTRLESTDAHSALGTLEGIILLDGSWSQAKTLWWRNPWLLKTTRIVLDPPRPSLYGRLRKEPRRESVSTLEAMAMIMTRLENNAEIEMQLLRSFQRLLHRYRDLKKAQKPASAR